MKAEELRIGNWVKGDTGKPFQIELSDFLDWWNDHNSHEYGDHIHPIPLTEDWLVKFGFKRYDEYPIWVIDIKDSPFEDDFRIEIVNGGYQLADYYFVFQYVHQLQNLYFALTGEELNLK